MTLPGDRRDDLVRETAAAIADWFGRVVIYEDSDLRGRRTGEMTELISTTLTARRPGITIETASGPAGALRAALALASGPGAILLLHETFGRGTGGAGHARRGPLARAGPGDRDGVGRPRGAFGSLKTSAVACPCRTWGRGRPPARACAVSPGRRAPAGPSPARRAGWGGTVPRARWG